MYSGENVSVGKPATDKEINALKSSLWTVLPKLDLTDGKQLSKEQLMTDKTFKAFCENHLRSTQYGLTIKKCINENCTFHGTIPTEKDVFEKIVGYHHLRLILLTKTNICRLMKSMERSQMIMTVRVNTKK
jgi:hypothetical protein